MAAPSPVPRSYPTRPRMGAADVDAVEEATRILRSVDGEHGGGHCVDTVVGALPMADALLRVPASTGVAARMRRAVADLHNLAGWVCFDTGLHDDSLRQFHRALELAGADGDNALTADVRYRLGRVYLHHGATGRASAEFRLGTRAALACGSALAMAILHANQAWAQARMGAREETQTLLARAAEEFAMADPDEAPGWAAFFTTTDLLSLTGTVHTELAQTVDPRFADLAVSELSVAAKGYSANMVRSKAMCLISLSTALLVSGHAEHGTAVGHEAVDLCQRLDSVRTTARLLLLGKVVSRLRGRSDGLTARIDALRPATTHRRDRVRPGARTTP
ncbi:tetratricopeptide repeat protein [Umezawaea sp. Da 62-37]|uniref:tetratricopeptide repeat protein n=1 Tax=Umezawaea sp. Da 62-37 TaxID=3075927 RepID=UPI0028F70451|nr:tetratricopeptide repeat protein [Umezawaea sp. Da 62-37]WNV86051.1 tetratricopeptide repeat protein [Umezawaea sp. Da 62-37]